MSFHCRVGNSSLLLRTLSVLSLGRDSWATVAFTPTVVIFHTAGDEMSTTATATLPSEMFLDYHVAGDVRFMVNLGAMCDALTLLGAHAVASAFIKVILAFPTSDGRLLVELADQQRTAQTLLVTRGVKERLLDLRFSDALTSNRVILRGDAAQEAVQDLVSLGCSDAEVMFLEGGGSGIMGGAATSSSTAPRVVLAGSKSVLGSINVSLNKSADSVLLLDIGDPAVKGKYLTSHLALAVGLHARALSSSISRAVGQSGGGGGNPQQFFGDCGFEKLSLLLNQERQLCVLHQGREHDIQVAISIVITPLFAGLD